jgi:hypothetical protein
MKCFIRWFSLDESAVSLDGSLEAVAEARLSSAVASSGDAADFGVYLFLGDGEAVEQLYIDTSVAWESLSSWLSAGDIAASSVVRIPENMYQDNGDNDGYLSYQVDRDVLIDLVYDDGAYSYITTLTDSESSDGYNYNSVSAVGEYGGDFAKW